MDLGEFLSLLRRRWWIVALLVIACLGSAAIITKLETPVYRASTQLIVNGTSNLSEESQIANRSLASGRATTFAAVIPSKFSVEAAVRRADKNGSFPGAGYPTVTASASGNDPFIEVQVSDTDPHLAEAAANAFVAVLPNVMAQIDQPMTQPDEVVVLQPARFPSSPASPRPFQNLLIGFMLGLVLGFSAAFALESIDTRLRDSDDVVAATELPMLGVVPYEMPEEPIPVTTFPMSARAEAYRRVRANIAFMAATGIAKSVIVTSATSSEGKTSLAVNLAIASAQAGQRVVLVDADLRRPMVQTYLQLATHPGLVHVLTGTVSLAEALQSADIGSFDVLTAGPMPPNPNELIGSASMRETLRQLKSAYDLVIVDTAPILPVADTLHLSLMVGGVIIVARIGETTRERLRRTKEALERVHANIIGVVPNGVIQREDSAYFYAYTYADRAVQKKKQPVSTGSDTGR